MHTGGGGGEVREEGRGEGGEGREGCAEEVQGAEDEWKGEEARRREEREVDKRRWAGG